MPEFSLHALNGAQPVDPVFPKLLSNPLACLTPEDREKFHEFGWGADVVPRHATISAAIAYWLRAQPDTIAVECGSETMSYQELDQASNKLVAVLFEHGVRRGDTICLYLRRSLEMVVGIVAAMKLGAAYVPQHVGVAPEQGLRHIAKVTNAKVVLTLGEMAGQVPVQPRQTLIAIDDVLASDTSSPEAADLFLQQVEPDDLAMILFTSGTTGVPNGVQVTHRNLANILLTAPGGLGMRPGLKVGQILSIAFDMAAWEILGALSNGATLVIRGKSIQETAEEVDILIATPSILASLDHERCQGVKVAAVAGEPCPRSLADTWSSFCIFYNSCGPTETTIINTAETHIPEKEVLSIGRPTPNNTVYILDDDLQPLPIGEKGEMWAGGDCVTAGYLANRKLTDERYRPDPFQPGQMMFRTRDLGRWNETGELEHFGRVDDLVKIRGFRVELDGVSSALERADCCIRAVTLKLDDRNLVSFISPASACPEKAREQVSDSLPYYCMPTVVLPLPELPRTPRGKLDKHLLHKLAQTHIAGKSVELN
ncbi:AMP-binding protein [uncultured Roseibium sp.]|uniref:AMP-binding protein n=1 Tax=uncultured Roseibium sp. TaxID=1936171 RepID=UPI0026397092|nr:AMP-binding protein [uncultured Roseibium sp.]